MEVAERGVAADTAGDAGLFGGSDGAVTPYNPILIACASGEVDPDDRKTREALLREYKRESNDDVTERGVESMGFYMLSRPNSVIKYLRNKLKAKARRIRKQTEEFSAQISTTQRDPA